jgi:23S rRNA (adenine2030-N6)-methyltransferase
LLSYRHSFHAGNFADILKHIVLVEILQHYTKKDKPFDYIDTHAGAGVYNLKSEQASKLAEHSNGIGKLVAADWPELGSFFQMLSACNRGDSINYYPGSPLIAKHFLRSKDNAWLYELHSKDFELLKKNTTGNRRVKAMNQDGLSGVLSHLPPVSRRALVLMDPSYEIKTDYDQVVKTIQAAHKKFATGTYALWYPVIDRFTVNKLEKRFINSGIKDIQRFELSVSADSKGHGMTGSGMMIVNPPWGLSDKMSKLLPKLVKALAVDEGASFRCEVLVPE